MDTILDIKKVSIKAMKKVGNKVTKKARKKEGKRGTDKAIPQDKQIHELAPCVQVEECKLIFRAMDKVVTYVEIRDLKNVYIVTAEVSPIINLFL